MRGRPGLPSMSQFPNNPYMPQQQQFAPRPVAAGPPPAVITWQLVYLACMTVLYLLFAVMGIVFLINADTFAANDPTTDATEVQIMGAIYAVLGVGLAILFAGGILVRRGMVGWVYNLILIGIGLTSCCFWPATIPLMIFWIKGKDYIVHQ